MKITHYLESLDSKGGGLPASVKSLTKQQLRLNYDISITTLKDLDLKTRDILTSVFNALNKLIINKRTIIDTPSTHHLHGVWNIKLWIKVLSNIEPNDQIVLSPHGQLMKNLLASDSVQKKIKKLIYIFTVLKPLLKLTDKIHAVGEAERNEILLRFKICNVYSIYNYIDDNIFNHQSSLLPKQNWQNNLALTFLGRLDERKGIIDLINAVTKIQLSKRIILRIIGPQDDAFFISKINRLIEKNQSINIIVLENAKYGDEKIRAFEESAVICLPSYSEVIGLVNIESALLKRCVITTFQSNIPEIKDHGGYLIDNNQDSLISCIEMISNLSYEDYVERCNKLHNWAKDEFEIEHLHQKWIEFYRTNDVIY